MAPTRFTLALGLAIALASLAFAGPASAGPLPDDDVVARELYVAGLSTAQNQPIQHRQAHCVETGTAAGSANVGGVCDVAIPTGDSLAILVDDLALDRVPFHYQTHTEPGETGDCPGGHSVGETTVVPPEGCTRLDVWVAAPSAGGVITVKRADAVII